MAKLQWASCARLCRPEAYTTKRVEMGQIQSRRPEARVTEHQRIAAAATKRVEMAQIQSRRPGGLSYRRTEEALPGGAAFGGDSEHLVIADGLGFR